MITIAYLILYIICALNIVWGIRKSKSNALYAVALVVIFALMTFNSNGPDIGVYRQTYELVEGAADLKGAFNSTYMEKGYTLFMFCASRIGLDFYAFRIVVSIFCLALFVSINKYYKVNPNMIVGLYMAYLFIFDTIQLRNCIAQFIILFATRYLFCKSGLSIIKYTLCIAIAGSIHVLSWLFLSLLLIKVVKTKIGYQRIFCAASVLFVLCIFIRPFLPQIVEIIVKIINRGSGYFTGTLRFNYIVIMGLHMLGLAPLYIYKNKITNKETKDKVIVILKIEIIMGLFLPFTFLNSNFNRIFRNILILDTIGLTLLYENLKKNTEANDVTIAAQILLVGLWLGTDMFRNRSNENLIDSIFKYNLLNSHIDSADILQYCLVIVICLISFLIIKKIFSHLGDSKKRMRGIKCA